jgi:hypothetical protein
MYRVLVEVFGLTKGEVTRYWRRLHNEELQCPVPLSKYYSGDQIKIIRWVGHVVCMYGSLVVKSEKKKPLARPRYIEKNNIKMDLKDWDVEVCTVLIWHKIKTGCGLL